jgi:hypothetical protein
MDFKMFRFKPRAALVAVTAIAALALPASALATNVTVWSVTQATGRLGTCTAAAPYAGVPTVLYDGNVEVVQAYGSYLDYGNETFGVNLAWYQGINIPYTWEFIRPPGRYLFQQIPASEPIALYNTVNHQYLAEGDETFGIGLVWSQTPQYQWQVANGGDPPSDPCNGELYNDVEKAYLIDYPRRFGVDLGWIHAPFETGPNYIPPTTRPVWIQPVSVTGATTAR